MILMMTIIGKKQHGAVTRFITIIITIITTSKAKQWKASFPRQTDNLFRVIDEEFFGQSTSRLQKFFQILRNSTSRKDDATEKRKLKACCEENSRRNDWLDGETCPRKIS